MAELQKKMAELQKASTDKIMKLLTAAQKTKWKELQGEAFKGELRFEPPVLLLQSKLRRAAAG